MPEGASRQQLPLSIQAPPVQRPNRGSRKIGAAHSQQSICRWRLGCFGLVSPSPFLKTQAGHSQKWRPRNSRQMYLAIRRCHPIVVLDVKTKLDPLSKSHLLLGAFHIRRLRENTKDSTVQDQCRIPAVSGSGLPTIQATFPRPPNSPTNLPDGFSALWTPPMTASGSVIQCKAALENTASNSRLKRSFCPSIH